jgi:hypothetical protein
MSKATYIVYYVCRDSRGTGSCDEDWSDEVRSRRAWGYCPACGKRTQAVSARVAGSDS